MSVALFGGTFDPVHFGHVSLVLDMVEKKGLKKVIVMPCFLSPHKVESPPLATPRQRFEMVKLAFLGIDQVEVSDFEIKKEKISYTIDTLKFLKQKFNDISIILEENILDSFSLWKDYSEILKISSLLIGGEKDLLLEDRKEIVKIRKMQISSTCIRERFKKKVYTNHLLPNKVIDYIISNNIY